MTSKRIGDAALVAVLLVLASVPSVITVPESASARADASSAALTEYWEEIYTDQYASLVAAGTEQLEPDLLAKAEPDECFNGPGVPYTGTAPLCEPCTTTADC